MASYHCEVKVGGKGKAGPHASYISREGKYEKVRTDEILECVQSGNMPKWAEKDPAQFWQAADQHERANGATYREIEIALPRELTAEQRLALVHDFVSEEVGDKHAYTFAIHNGKAAIDGGEQPHAHVMYSERTIDGIARDPEQYFKRYNAKAPEKGGCRKDSAGTEERLLATRERWAKVQNLHLERHGHEARVDHRSLKNQGIERAPEPHFGPGRVKHMTATQDADLSAVLERRVAEGEKERAAADLVKSIIDLSGDLVAAKAEQVTQQKERNEHRTATFDRIGSNLQTAGRAGADAGRALLASKQSLIAATSHTRDIERGAQGAIEGIERRVAERDYGRVVEAAKRQFERAGSVVQQAVGNIDLVIRPIAAAAQHIEIYTLERDRQAKERAQAERQIIGGADLSLGCQNTPVARPVRPVAPNPRAGMSAKQLWAAQQAAAGKVAGIEKTVAASDLTPAQRAIVMARVLENAAAVAPSIQSAPKAGAVASEVPTVKAKQTRLTSDDVALFRGAAQALAAGDIKTLASHLRKIDQVESKLTAAATPNGWDTKPFDSDSANRQLAARDFDRRREAINSEAKARGEKQIPFAVGQQSTLISATFDYSQKAAGEALTRHVKSDRPLGLFRRETKDTKAWDAQRAALETTKTAWDGAVAARDRAEHVAKEADHTTFFSRLDVIRKEHATKSDAAIAKCAPARDRLKDFEHERERIERATEALSQPKQRELSIEIDRGRDRGISR